MPESSLPIPFPKNSTLFLRKSRRAPAVLGRLPLPATWRAATYEGPHSGGAPCGQLLQIAAVTFKPFSLCICADNAACSSWCKSGCCWPQPGTWSRSQLCSSWKAAMEGKHSPYVCHAAVSTTAASPQHQGCQCCQQERLETSFVHNCSWACLAPLNMNVSKALVERMTGQAGKTSHAKRASVTPCTC